MTRQDATTHAAREVIAHGSPIPGPDPDRAGRALDQALAAGATLADIATEIARQRGA